MYKYPSRILNEGSQVLGLNANDLIALGVIYLVTQNIFVPLGLEFVPLLILLITGITLISIRLKYRRKIVRDYLKYFFRIVFRERKIYGR